MSHFILHMLSEAQLLGGYSDLCKEEVDSANEVTQNRVIDHTLEREKARKKTQTLIPKEAKSWFVLLLQTT